MLKTFGEKLWMEMSSDTWTAVLCDVGAWSRASARHSGSEHLRLFPEVAFTVRHQCYFGTRWDTLKVSEGRRPKAWWMEG